MITVLVSLGIIIGLPILLIFLYAKKNSIGWGDPFIKEKQYSTAERENFLRKTFGVAKRVSFISQIFIITSKQSILSFILFLVTLLGIDACEYSIHLNVKGNFLMTGGLFIYILIYTIIIFTILGLWSGISYKRLEFLLIQLGNVLEGASELDDAAARANFKHQVMKVSGVSYAKTGRLEKSVKNIADHYLDSYQQNYLKPKFYKIINFLLSVSQIGIAVFMFEYALT